MVYYKAFVSSTYEDLKQHRAHVIASLRRAGIFVDPMEEWTAESDAPKEFSRERLEGCDFCVLLVALRRGFVPEGETESITQLEYQAAVGLGMDVLVYLLDESAPWPHSYDELNSDPQVRKWRSSLENRHGRSLFGTEPSTLDVAPAVTRWIAKQAREPRATEVRNGSGQMAAALRTPWLGIEFWQAQERVPLALHEDDVAEAALKPAPFELRLPNVGQEGILWLTAWTDRMIFDQISTDMDREDVPYFRPATGMADTPFGSGRLFLTAEAHHHLTAGGRLFVEPNGTGRVAFNRVIMPDRTSGFPRNGPIYMVVHLSTLGSTVIQSDSVDRIIVRFG